MFLVLCPGPSRQSHHCQMLQARPSQHACRHPSAVLSDGNVSVRPLHWTPDLSTGKVLAEHSLGVAELPQAATARTMTLWRPVMILIYVQICMVGAMAVRVLHGLAVKHRRDQLLGTMGFRPRLSIILYAVRGFIPKKAALPYITSAGCRVHLLFCWPHIDSWPLALSPASGVAHLRRCWQPLETADRGLFCR